MNNVIMVSWNFGVTNETVEECFENVGKNGCIKIDYFTADVESPVQFCDIYYEDGKMRRVFNLSEILFSK